MVPMNISASPVMCPLVPLEDGGDAVLQLCSRLLGEREGDHVSRRNVRLLENGRDPLADDLSLPRAGARDDLQGLSTHPMACA
jgi:hypothetical protein